jgi:hypothetical protein
MQQGFIFHDPTGRRWVRFRRGLQLAGALVAIALVLIGLSILTSPQLPVLGLGNVAHVGNLAEVRSIISGEKAARNVPFDPKLERAKLKYVRSATPVIHQKTAAKIQDEQPLVFGYFVNWDPAAMVSLRLNLNRLTHLVPEWLVLQNGNGDISDESDPTVIRIAADAHLPVLAMLTNFRNGWQAKDLHKVLSNRDHASTSTSNN